MKVLLFQMYGNRRAYHLELTYSILSAFRFLKDRHADIQIVLAADEANMRPDLPVEHLLMTPKMLYEWQLGGKYNHAVKPHILAHALDVFGAPTIQMDTDTVFHSDLARLFDNVGPGRTLMNKCEGPLIDSPAWDQWETAVANSGGDLRGYKFSPSTKMYNSGVVGIDPQDAGHIAYAISVMQRIVELSDMFTAEQLATSIVLSHHTEVTTCEDSVEHYWDGPRVYYQHQMNSMFPCVLEGAGIKDATMQLEPLQKDLKGTLSSRIAARIKRLQRRAGPEYGAAYTAYISGLALRNTDAALANVWADRSLNLLQWALRQERPVGIRHDFHLFTEGSIDQQEWMKPELRDRWRGYWADAKTCNTERLSQ